MKILVTGANGYLGTGIVNSLINNGFNVIAAGHKLDRINSKADKIECDIFNVKDPYYFFGEPDILLHLAWRDGFIHYSSAHIEDLPKHYYFIKSFAESELKKIVCLGSMHEIGFYEGAINDSTPCNPVTPYGICKNALRELTEILCNKNNKKFQWLRGYYIVGNSQYGSSIFSKITAAELEGKKDFPFTTGQNQFDFLDYDEFCKQITMAVSQDDILGIINICSGHPEKLADKVEEFIKINNYKIKLKYGVFPDRPYDSKAVWGDSSKILNILSKVNNNE